MDYIKFSDWLKLREVGTGSNCVAAFHQPVTDIIRRDPYGWTTRSKKKKISEKVKDAVLRILSAELNELTKKY